MFKLNEDLSIYATRGDIVFFKVKALKNGERHTFEAGDVVRIKVFNKKDCHCVVLQKDFPVTENTQEVDVYLTSEETTIGGVISKPVDYWYEIELNPDTAPQTIVGYDDDGAKVFRLFPEGKDVSDITEDDAEKIPQKTLQVLVENAVTSELGTGKYNGKDGNDGRGIELFWQSKQSTTPGDTIEWTILYTDGTESKMVMKNAENGKDGLNGKNGESAYDLACQLGFEGTEEEWMESLHASVDLSGIEGDIATLQKQMADVLYEAIAINSFTNNINTAEKGSTVTAVNLSWTFNKSPESLTLDGETMLPALAGTTLSGVSISDTKTFTLKATDERGATATKTTSINFYNRIRYGAAADYTELALSDGILSNTKGRTFTATAGEGQYIWYMLPKWLGACSFKVGNFDGGFRLLKTELLANASGYTEEYYIYRSDNAALGETTVTVA